MRIYPAALCLMLAHSLVAQERQYTVENGQYRLTVAGASHLASLPMKCIPQHFPYRTGVTYTDSTLIVPPERYHPAFCGCFDWHSSVHGHWMLVRLLRMFPNMPEADRILTLLRQQLTYTNINGELQLFKDGDNRSFERTYGWAWLLTLQRELLQWNEPAGKQLAQNVQPMASLFSTLYRDFLNKLAYPIRVGEHSNLAFGLKLAWDYAVVAKDDSLQTAIRDAALRFYKNDEACPISWEPGGTDFLSPCLEEADLMWRVMPAAQYQNWIRHFLPSLFHKTIRLAPGQVRDRSDGRLVHLDGLNFSRASCLYNIARHAGSNRAALIKLANVHLDAALPHVATGEYMGEHWLASFAVYALTVSSAL